MHRVPRNRNGIAIVGQPAGDHSDQGWLLIWREFERELPPMMLIRPDHQGSRIPLRMKTDSYLCAEDIVIGRRKEEHRRRVVDCAVERINKPISLLARTNGEDAARFDVP